MSTGRSPAPDRIWLTRTVAGFSFASLFSDLGHEWVTALLPGFLAALGAPPLALGTVEGVSNLGQALAGRWGGRLADASPRRWDWMTAGYLATALKALLAVVYAWPWAVLLRTVAWMGRGWRGPIRNTIMAEEVPPAHRGKAYGFREALDTLGAVLGPLLAVLLLPRVAVRPQLALSAVPGVAALAIVALAIPRRPPPARAAGTLPAPPGAAFRRAAGALIRFQLGWIAPTLFILRVERAGAAGATLTAILLYVLHNLTYALGSYPAGAWADRHGTAGLLPAAGAAATVTLAGFALGGRHLWLWVLLFALAGLVTAAWETGQKPWILRTLEPANRGAGFGRLALGLGLAQLSGNLLVTAIWTGAGASAAFGTAALLAAYGTVSLQRASRF